MKNKISRNNLMHWTNMLLLIPVTVLTFSGLVMQILYHLKRKPESFSYLELDKAAWLTTHKISAIVCLLLVVYHLYLNLNWLKKVFSNNKPGNGKRIKKYSLWLSIIFVLATITSLFSWLVIEDKHQAWHMIEIHDKLSIILIVLLIIHLIRHYTWFKKLLKKKTIKL